jgi:Na+/proline symporter
MNFEDLQKVWQSQNAGGTVTKSTDALLEEVRRNQQQFRSTIFWRDVREVGVAFLLVAFFGYLGLRRSDWTYFLIAAACFGVGSFMLIDRWRQRQKQPAANDSLKACAENSLFQVNHQIWLLRNVGWWYLLPIAVALGISTGVSVWHSHHHRVLVVLGGCLYLLIVALVYWGIYWLNQFAVRNELIPRQAKLEALLANMK